MSECVVRMEMPKHCGECELQIWDIWPGSFKCAKTRTDIMSHMRNRTKPNDCPIICQLPEGHGRLGDLDELAKMVNAARIEAMQKGFDTNPYWLLGDIIAQAKTIVPAEAERSE